MGVNGHHVSGHGPPVMCLPLTASLRCSIPLLAAPRRGLCLLSVEVMAGELSPPGNVLTTELRLVRLHLVHAQLLLLLSFFLLGAHPAAVVAVAVVVLAMLVMRVMMMVVVMVMVCRG